MINLRRASLTYIHAADVAAENTEPWADVPDSTLSNYDDDEFDEELKEETEGKHLETDCCVFTFVFVCS